MSTVKHSGNIGDIIYSLPTVLKLSKQNNESINFLLNPVDNRMSIELANIVTPLLEHQPYIDRVDIYKNQHVDYDLDLFRTMHIPTNNLGEMHAQVYNFDFEILHEQSLFITPDLNFDLPTYDIIINRTERYNNPNFPWQHLLNTEYKDQTKCFVGLKHEYDLFQSTYQIKNLDYIATDNLLQVAYLINKSELFIGNCSSPYAIAETMKHKTIQESCTWCLSCLYPRDNAYYFTNQFFKYEK